MKLVALLLGLVVMVSCTSNKVDGPSKVELKKNEQGENRLYVNGNEFFVDGAGLEFGNIKALAENGGNSFRTWRTEDGQRNAVEILDEAHENGLMVLMGLEIGRERHGISYDDTVFVNKQFSYVKSEVERLKNHPALLGWAIGNELNLGQKDLRIYDEVNRISQMIHEIDPNHVTTTTTAGIGKDVIDYIKEHCTDLDFMSIQMYGDIVNLQKRIADAGWDGPYIVTEWGATGHWEVARTEWDVAIEQTSKEKAAAFIERYKLAILADPINCMGSYVFLWGQKQERTPTWYGMFLENGAKTETVDAMQYLWTGKYPDDRCPSVDSFKIEGKTAYDNVKVKLSTPFNAEVFYTNFENDTLAFNWEIIPESTDHGWGGDFESRPATSFHGAGGSSMELHAPDSVGPYRLFVYVTDTNGNAGTANIPFFVEE